MFLTWTVCLEFWMDWHINAKITCPPPPHQWTFSSTGIMLPCLPMILWLPSVGLLLPSRYFHGVPKHSVALVNLSFLDCELLEGNGHDWWIFAFSYHNDCLRAGPSEIFIASFGVNRIVWTDLNESRTLYFKSSDTFAESGSYAH